MIDSHWIKTLGLSSRLLMVPPQVSSMLRCDEHMVFVPPMDICSFSVSPRRSLPCSGASTRARSLSIVSVLRCEHTVPVVPRRRKLRDERVKCVMGVVCYVCQVCHGCCVLCVSCVLSVRCVMCVKCVMCVTWSLQVSSMLRCEHTGKLQIVPRRRKLRDEQKDVEERELGTVVGEVGDLAKQAAGVGQRSARGLRGAGEGIIGKIEGGAPESVDFNKLPDLAIKDGVVGRF